MKRMTRPLREAVKRGWANRKEPWAPLAVAGWATGWTLAAAYATGAVRSTMDLKIPEAIIYSVAAVITAVLGTMGARLATASRESP